MILGPTDEDTSVFATTGRCRHRHPLGVASAAYIGDQKIAVKNSNFAAIIYRRFIYLIFLGLPRGRRSLAGKAARILSRLARILACVAALKSPLTERRSTHHRRSGRPTLLIRTA